MNFSERLRELRAEKDVTQIELAKKTGLSNGCIAMLEINKREPTGNTLIALSNFFECSIDYLLGREDDLGNITIHTEKPASLPQDEQELLNIYQALSPAHRSQILEYARYFAEKSGAASTRRKA